MESSVHCMKKCWGNLPTDWIKTVASTSHELNEHNRENGSMMESSVHCMKKCWGNLPTDWIKTVASTSHELNEHNREKGIMMELVFIVRNNAQETYMLIESKQ